MPNDEPKDFNYSASHVANFFLQKGCGVASTQTCLGLVACR